MGLSQIENPVRRQLLGTLGTAGFLLSLAALDALSRGQLNLPALVPPFGASAVIVFFGPRGAPSQTWNIIVGHACSALAAATVLWLLPAAPVGVLAALAVSLAGLTMLATRSFHPPGGATALFAVVAGRDLGFAMTLCPMLTGAVLLVFSRALLDGSIGLTSRLALLRAAALEPNAQRALSSSTQITPRSSPAA